MRNKEKERGEERDVERKREREDKTDRGRERGPIVGYLPSAIGLLF